MKTSFKMVAMLLGIGIFPVCAHAQMKQYVQIKFVKVKGHSNDKYNDYADMLAKSALGIGDGSFEKKEDQEWIKVR